MDDETGYGPIQLERDALRVKVKELEEAMGTVKDFLECANLKTERQPDYIRIALQVLECFEKKGS